MYGYRIVRKSQGNFVYCEESEYVRKKRSESVRIDLARVARSAPVKRSIPNKKQNETSNEKHSK